MHNGYLMSQIGREVESTVPYLPQSPKPKSLETFLFSTTQHEHEVISGYKYIVRTYVEIDYRGYRMRSSLKNLQRRKRSRNKVKLTF